MVDLEVKEMTCGHCVSAITQAVRLLDSHAELHVDLRAGRVRQSRNSPAELIKALGDAGYPATIATAPARGAGSPKGGCCGCGR